MAGKIGRMNPVLLLVAIGLVLLAGTPARGTLRVVPEARPAEPRPAEPRPADPRPSDARPVEPRPADTRPAEVRPALERPVESRPANAPRDVASPPVRADRPVPPRDASGGQRARPGAASANECSDDLINLSLGIDEPGKDRSKSPQCR